MSKCSSGLHLSFYSYVTYLDLFQNCIAIVVWVVLQRRAYLSHHFDNSIPEPVHVLQKTLDRGRLRGKDVLHTLNMTSIRNDFHLTPRPYVAHFRCSRSNNIRVVFADDEFGEIWSEWQTETV